MKKFIHLAIILFLANAMLHAQIQQMITAGSGAAAPVAPTVVACASANTGTSGTPLVVTYAPTTGNSLEVLLVGEAATITSAVLNPGSQAITLDNSLRPGTTNQRIGIGHYFSVPASVTGVTMTFGAGGRSVGVVCEVTGVLSTDVIDAAGTNQVPATWSSPTIATTYANDIVWGAAAQISTTPCTGTPMTMTGYTVPTNGFNCSNFNQVVGLGYLVVSSTGNQTASGTVADSGGTHTVVATIGSYKGN